MGKKQNGKETNGKETKKQSNKQRLSNKEEITFSSRKEKENWDSIDEISLFKPEVFCLYWKKSFF